MMTSIRLLARGARQLASRPARAARGQSLVELAVTVTILGMLLLGTIDLGRLYFDYVDLKTAARNGARYGVLTPTDTAGMRTRALNSSVPAGTSVSAICTGNCSTVGATGTVVVTASSSFTSFALGFFTFAGIDGSFNL